MQKKLLLINPSFGRHIMGQLPLNLAYLAAAVFQYAQVKIIDLNVQPIQKLERILEKWKPTYVGMSRYTPNNISSMELLKKIKEQYPNIITIVGGPHEIFRGHITENLFPWIDHVVSDRKGENALAKIITGEDKKIDWRTLFPAYHLLDMMEGSYHFDSNLFGGKRMIQYMSSRGCNMNCNFCGSDSYTALENKTVIEHLCRIAKLGYRAVFFNDVNFASNPKRTADLMQLIIEEGLELEWGCQTVLVEGVSLELLQLMARAGCSYLTFSIENVSQNALRQLGKKISPRSVMTKAKFAKSIGMKTGAYVMFGIHENEDVDFQWAQKTLDRVEEILPDFVSYSILADYPSANQSLPYETVEFGKEDIWELFDEGKAHHPYCSISHAQRLYAEIQKRHARWPSIKIF